MRLLFLFSLFCLVFIQPTAAIDLEDLEQLDAMDRDDSASYLKAAEQALKQLRLKEATRQVKKAKTIAPNPSASNIKSVERKIDKTQSALYYLRKAQKKLDNEYFDSARSELKKAKRADPGYVSSRIRAMAQNIERAESRAYARRRAAKEAADTAALASQWWECKVKCGVPNIFSMKVKYRGTARLQGKNPYNRVIQYCRDLNDDWISSEADYCVKVD